MTTESMRRPVLAHSARLKLPSWREIRAQFARPELAFDWLRVYLGLGLVVRGALFASDPGLLEQFIGNGGWLLPMALAHGLVLAHLVGGFMLALGCCTRFAAAVQIPFVAGAVFLVHWQEGLLTSTQSLEFSALVLVMLILYAICGAADFSIDHYMRSAPVEIAIREPAISMQRASQAPPPVSTPVRGAPLAVNVDDGRADVRAELAGAGLDLPPEPAHSRAENRTTKRELTMLLVSMGVLVVLLAQGAYIAAAAWLIVAVVMFTIWLVGQTQLD